VLVIALVFRKKDELCGSLQQPGLQGEEINRASALRPARLLQQRDILPEETVRAIEGLTVLRNLSTHGRAGELTVERAVEYVALAQAVLFAVEQTARTHRPEHPQ
jgi:hypothetical protein